MVRQREIGDCVDTINAIREIVTYEGGGDSRILFFEDISRKGISPINSVDRSIRAGPNGFLSFQSLTGTMEKFR